MLVTASGHECDVRTARKCYNERTVSRITWRKAVGLGYVKSIQETCQVLDRIERNRRV